MSLASPSAGELLELLDDALAATADLAGRLGAEFAALESDDVDALLAATAAKKSSLATLESLESRRCGWLGNRGFRDDADGMDRLLAETDDDRCADRWRDYLAAAADCRRANLTNGAIIRLRNQQVGKALGVLAGAATSTYGPAGNERAVASRPLARA